MGIIRKLAIRNMKRRKTRYVLTTVTLIIGVALFGGVLIANDSFQVTFISDIDRRMGTADILLRNTEHEDGWFDADDLDEIEKIDHVTDITFRVSGFNIYATSVKGASRDDDNSTFTAVYGIDPDSKDEGNLGGPQNIIDSEVDGTSMEDLLEDAEDDEIVITESLQIKLGKDFEAGDDVYLLPVDYELRFPESERELVISDSSLWPKYKVLAIVRDWGEARDFDPETPEEFSQPSRAPCIFSIIDTAHDLVDGINDYSDKFNLVAIGVDDINIVEDVIDDIEDELDDDYWVACDLKTESVENINNSMVMMRTMFLMFALVALILSIILILNIFNIIKEEQEYETGMLQAVGSSKAETFRMFLTQGLIMGVIGAIIGTICSYFMSYFIFWMTVQSLRNLPGFIGEYFEEFEFQIVLYPETLGITFAVGVVSCILASIYPSWKASRKPIIECLNPLAQKTERLKKHFKRRILYGIIASSLILIGGYLLFTLERGRGAGEEEAIVSMMAPTIMLLGIIGILDLFVGPLTRVFVKFFGRYLKQTQLLTRKNVLRHRKRTILTFSMISLTTSYLIGLSVFMGSMSAGVQTTVDDVMGCDLRIIAADTPLEFKEKLNSRSGVEDVMGVTYKNVQMWDEDENEWVGHRALEKEWDVSISAIVVEKGMMKKYMDNTPILDPSDDTFDEVMNNLNQENTIMITDETADRFDLEEGDTIPVRFTLGVDYPSLEDMRYRVDDNAVEVTVTVELEVVAVVEKVQGFGFSNLIGQDVESYSIFISWRTWDALAQYSLPSGGTDIMFRQTSQSGEPSIDIVQSNWFKFSDVIGAIENVSNVEYYTTRMDYFSPTYDLNITFNPFDPLINFGSSVVGIRTNSSGKLKDDSYFGQHQLIEKSSAYKGTTMEELLNQTTFMDKVCVVDQTYVNKMREFNATKEFGINSTIAIFPQEFDATPITIPTNSSWAKVTVINGTNTDGTEDELFFPSYIPFDTGAMNFTSNKTSLNIIIDYNMTNFMLYYMNPFDLSLTTTLNASVEYLQLEVLNHYTGKYDKLGDINSTLFPMKNFTFNQQMPAFSYINQSNAMMKFRIIGYNSTYDTDYALNIDYLGLVVNKSSNALFPPYPFPFGEWEMFKVIGIIKDPTMSRNERAFWPAGVEIFNIAEQTTNTVYINYEDARNYVYPMYKGSLENGTDDRVTSVLLHINNIEEIETSASQLRQELNNVQFGVWTVLDLKTPSLDIRTYANDWYIWIKPGEIDEEILDELIEYIEDQGYIVLFGFTRTFIEEMFRGMIELIVMITTGVLVFAIIISMIGLALHSLLSTMARRREIGMLRSIGLNKKGVVRTVSGETIIISLLGAFIGIFAGLLQGYLMVSAVPEGSFLTVTFTIPWLTIGILLLVTILTAIFSSRYPSKWAANLNIIDAVRTR